MRRSTKRKLLSRFRYWKFTQLLIANSVFRAVVIALVLLGLSAALALPKLWNVAPSGSEKVLRISLLDMVQAWSLSRTARQQEAAGDYEKALYSWGAAAANYPAKPSLIRSYLRTALKLPDSPKLARPALGQANTLLFLTQTNAADLALAARVFNRFQLPEVTLGLLREPAQRSAPEAPVVWANALYDAGLYQDFAAEWRTNEAALAVDPELALKRASLMDLFGQTNEAAAARITLAEAAKGGTNEVLAHRLLLRSAIRYRDPALAQRGLNALVVLKVDGPRDHAALWRVLIETGRGSEAATLMQTYARQPAMWSEAVELFDLAMLAGQTKRAEELVDWSLANLGFTPQLSLRKAALLIQRMAWSDLRQLGLEIRLRPNVPPTLQGFSRFLEGQALRGEGDLEKARGEFARLGEFNYDDPRFALDMARALIDTGEAMAALPLLSALEDKLQSRPEYWMSLMRVAGAEKNSVLLLRATEGLYRVNTNDLVAANEYAAALLIERDNPARALQLTSNLVVATGSNAPIPLLNYAGALLQNSQVTEARQFLSRFEVAKLPPEVANVFQLLSFNAAILARERDAAVELLAKIDRSKLYPPQVNWLEATARSELQITNASPGK